MTNQPQSVQFVANLPRQPYVECSRVILAEILDDMHQPEEVLIDIVTLVRRKVADFLDDKDLEACGDLLIRVDAIQPVKYKEQT